MVNRPTANDDFEFDKKGKPIIYTEEERLMQMAVGLVRTLPLECLKI